MSGILNGVRVVDLTRYIAGPYCGELLADMGAEVIKIEKPGSGEITRTAGPWTNGVSLFFQSVNRNKRSVTADMRTPEGLEIAKKLIAKSDVLIENFRAGTMEKMGLGYEDVKKINPSIIMVSITGFGQTGPLRDRLAFDGIISAMSGVTRMEGDHVERSKGPLHDYMAAMYGTMGTILALYEKRDTGKGQYIDVSMLAGSSMIRSMSIADAYLNGDEAAMVSDDSAPYGYLKGTDGWINYHAGTNPIYRNLLKMIDSPVLHQEKYLDNMELRVTDAKILEAEVQKWSEGKSCDEMEALFVEYNIPCGIVATPGRLMRSEHLRANGYIVQQPIHGIEGGAPFIGFPFKMSNHPNLEYRAAPELGDSTDDIYQNVLGMTPEEIQKLRDKGIV